NGEATSVAIIVPPFGRWLTSGNASTPYSLFANGSRPSSTSNTVATHLSRRERSSTRCEMKDISSPSVGSGLAMPILLRRLWREWLRRALDVGRGRGDVRAQVVRAARLVDRALEVFRREFAFDLAAHALPARARAPQQRANGARDLGQALRAEHEQRDHRDQRHLAESDVEHGGSVKAARLRRAGSGFDAIGFCAFGAGVGLGRVGLELRRVLLVAFGHALAEAADRGADVLADVAQALGAEHQGHDDQHDEPVP